MGSEGGVDASAVHVGGPPLILVLVALLVALVLPAHRAAGAPASGPVGGRLIPVRSAFNFWAVGCPPRGACVAVGQGARGAGVVVPVLDGTVATPHAAPGTLGLGGVACPSPNTCLAVGKSDADTGALVPIVRGRPERPVPVPGTYLYAIGCGTARSCWATGESTDLKHALVVHVVNFKVEHVYVLHGIYPGAFFGPDANSPAVGTVYGPPPVCTSATTCVAVGATGPYYGKRPGSGLVVSLAGGRMARAQTVPRTAQLVGVACVSAGMCLADGEVTSLGAPGQLWSIVHGGVGHRVATSVQGKWVNQLTGLACPSAGTCFVLSSGGYIAPSIVTAVPGSTPRVSAVTAIGSQGRKGFEGGFDQVSCTSSSCLAAGGEYDPSVPGHALGVLYFFKI